MVRGPPAMAHVSWVRTLPSDIWQWPFPMPAMASVEIRLAERELGGTRYASRRQDREPTARHVEGCHEGQVGVSTEAIPHALENLLATQAALRRVAGTVDGGSDGTVWHLSARAPVKETIAIIWPMGALKRARSIRHMCSTFGRMLVRPEPYPPISSKTASRFGSTATSFGGRRVRFRCQPT
jgi:hypothetical protein